MGVINFYYGVMNSGKSAQLLLREYNYKSKGLNTIVSLPFDSMRTKNKLTSRMGLSVDAVDTDKLLDIIANDYLFQEQELFVFIDECQFLSEDYIKTINIIASNSNISFFCYGLKSNFKGELFEGSKAILAIADKIVEFPSLCWCGNKAIMTGRMIDGSLVYDGQEYLVGDEEYIPLCRFHYLNNILK